MVAVLQTVYHDIVSRRLHVTTFVNKEEVKWMEEQADAAVVSANRQLKDLSVAGLGRQVGKVGCRKPL